MLTSHIATLTYYVLPLSEKLASPEFMPLIKNAVTKLEDAGKILSGIPDENIAPESLLRNSIQQRTQQLLKARRKELEQGILDSETKKQLSEFKPVADQFNFIDNITTDIRKISTQWVDE